MTNVTPEQLEEFESAFRSFDKDESNTLDPDELSGALRSLGVAEEVRPPYLVHVVMITDQTSRQTRICKRCCTRPTARRSHLVPSSTSSCVRCLGGSLSWLT